VSGHGDPHNDTARESAKPDTALSSVATTFVDEYASRFDSGTGRLK
jgi:hypothetical protein